MSHPTRRPLTLRQAPRIQALEARLMFDAAALADATATVTSHQPIESGPPEASATVIDAAQPATEWHLIQVVSPATSEGTSADLTQAIASAELSIRELLQQPDATQQLFKLFSGNQSVPSAEWIQSAESLLAAIRQGDMTFQVQLLSGADLKGHMGAFNAHGLDGRPVIYLNADWLATGTSAEAVTRVLVEEFGHGIDQALNGTHDTQGDEGEAFAAVALNLSLRDAENQRIALEDDHTTLVLDSVAAQVELSGTAQVSVPFPEGFIGTRGSNSGQADGIVNFSTLGITKASFFQNSTTGTFGGTQGNDLSGGLRLTLSSGEVITINGAINWRITSGQTLYVFGFIPDPATPVRTINYAGGTFDIDGTSNFGLEKVGAVYSAADNSNVSGNAATSGLLDSLNTYLATVQANDPNGPVTVNSLATNDTTPTLSGTATLGAGETLNVIVNGVSYTTSNGLSLGANNSWSLTIPGGSALTNGTYDVTATITNSAGYTLTDASSSELIVNTALPSDVTAPTATVVVADTALRTGETSLVTITFSEAVTGFTNADLTVENGTLSAVSSSDGGVTWTATFTPTANISDTTNVITLDNTGVIDAAGNAGSGSTDSNNYAIDTAPPTLTGPNATTGLTSAKSIPENTTAVHTFTASESVTWSIDGGADFARFSIDASGNLAFVSAPDHEAPNDLGATPGNNTYVVIVKATDTAGNATSQTVTVTVTDVDDTAPVVTTGQSFSYAENRATGTVLGTVAASDAVGITGWRFSTTGTSTSSDGYFSIDHSGQIALTAAGATAGIEANDFETGSNTFSHAVQAGDAAGNWSSSTLVTLSVTDVNETPANRAPVPGDVSNPGWDAANARYVAATPENTPVTGRITGSDADSDALTYTATSMPTHGTVIVDPSTGAWTYTPTTGYHGTDRFTVLVDDGRGGSTAVTVDITITPVNHAPQWADSALETAQDLPRSGQLPSATDADGDRLSYALANAPAHGTVSVDTDGRYTYTPSSGFSGTDRFQIRVTDTAGASTLAWVDVTVRPAPTLTLPTPWDLGTSDTDRVTSAPVITLAGEASAGQTLHLYAPSGAQIATVVADGNGRWSAPNIDLRTLTGDAALATAGATGPYTFSLRSALADGTEGAAVRLTVVRELPAQAPTVDKTPVADAPPPAVAERPTPSADIPASQAAPFDSALKSSPGPAGESLAPTDTPAALRVTPSPANDLGTNSREIYTRPSGFRVMVNPDPEPALKLFNGVDDQVVKLGQAMNLQIPADTFVHTQINETIKLQATQADGTPLPMWLRFDGKSGTLVGEPPAGWNRDVAVKITARDSKGREATAMFRIKVSDGSARQGAGLSHQLLRGEALSATSRGWTAHGQAVTVARKA